MPIERPPKVSGETRRDVLRAALTLAGAVGLPAVAKAQDVPWWEGIFNPGPSRQSRMPSPRAERQPAQLRDLRSNSVPWLSDQMLEATQAAIERYTRLVSAGGWPQVPGPRLMRPGDDDQRVPALRQRLRISGELDPSRSQFESYSFDSALEAAVAEFQARHGLRVSGRVDRPTFAQLNVTAEMRLAQLRLNYNRILNMVRGRVDDRYVLVNVPAFQLEAVERFQVQQRHRVIAGRTERQTPEIEATIRGLNFFPYWHVPMSVARLDIVPRMQKDPGYLAREHIRAFRGSYDGEEIPIESIDWFNVDLNVVRFRQDPGPWNALGLVRIDMPNAEIVYMHDTPMKNLFDQASRNYSAGCVRVQDVMHLVDWIAKYEIGWEEPGRAQAVVDAGQPLDVMLTRPLPVRFVYITAWGEPDGQVLFRPDIYDRDGAREFAGDTDPDAAPLPPNVLTP